MSGGAVLVTAAPGCTDNFLVCGVSDVVNGVSDVVNGVGDAVGGVVATANSFVDFWSDPAGNSFQMLQDGAKGLADDVLPAITHATLPDLTAEWFISSYKISFGLAIFVLVALLIPQFVRTARGHQSGRDLAESLGLYAPLFLVGAAFGPALGAILVKFFGSLSDALIGWGINTSSQTIVDKFSAMLDEGDKGAGLAGGAIVGIILMFFMICGLLVVVLILIVQLITLYFSGVLFPLGLVWIVDPTKRQFGMKIGYLWFGILASHPLLFFMLAIAYQMVSGSIDVFGESPTLERTVTLVVSILALLIAGLSPVLLTKFAPVLPMGGGGGMPGGGGGTIGSQSMQQADSKLQDSGSTSGSSGGGSPAGTSSMASSTGSQSSSGVGAEAEEASSSISAVTKGSAAAGGGEAAGAAAGATAAEGGLAAAGAAESATGVGAVVGIPTMIAAGATAAATATKKTTDAVGAAAAAPVEDHEEHYGKDSTS